MPDVTQLASDAVVNSSYAKVQNWLNNTSHLEAIGVNNSTNAYSVKNQSFVVTLSGDIMRVIWEHIPPVLDSGNISTLWYRGQLDWIDGVYSNEAWINALEWSGAEK